MFIEGEPGPDQRSAVFDDFEQMKKQILKAKALRPTSRKRRGTEPENRPESPELIHGQSAGPLADDEDEMDFVVPHRPDSPVSISQLDTSMVQDDAAPDQAMTQDAPPGQIPEQMLPHVVPVAFSADDEDEELDLLQEAMDQVNEVHMAPNEESDMLEAVETLRPDSPRVMEEEATVHRQRPEFATVDEVIPTFPTDKQQQELHPDPGESDNLLIMSTDDVQAVESRMLLNLSDDEDDTAAVDASMDEELPVNGALNLSEPFTPKHRPKKGWRRWFGMD
jgi:hypothetical protein